MLAGNTVSPIKSFTTNIKKRKADECTGVMLEFVIAGMSGEVDCPAALMFSGDFYSLKEFIKDGMKYEQEVNRVTIPVPRDACPAKFLSSKLLNDQLCLMDSEVLDMVKFVRENMEVRKPLHKYFGKMVNVPSSEHFSFFFVKSFQFDNVLIDQFYLERMDGLHSSSD